MRASEAVWVRSALERLLLGPTHHVVELGSSTAEFRTVRQPHIEREIHAPLRHGGVRIVTTDLQAGPGIDISGNIYDPDIQKRIRGIRADCMLCCNILEHVTDRVVFANVVDQLLPAGGHLLVTVPHSYPYHLDPIDTMFRPSIPEIVKLFKGYQVIDSRVIVDTTYGRELVQQHGWRGLPIFLAKSVAKLVTIRGGLDAWKARNHRFLWLFRPYKTVGVLLRKPVSHRDDRPATAGTGASRNVGHPASMPVAI